MDAKEGENARNTGKRRCETEKTQPIEFGGVNFFVQTNEKCLEIIAFATLL